MYLKYKQKLIVGVALIVVACLIISSIFVYLIYTAEEKVEEEVVEKGIDDRISPLTNQAVSLEIHRIRKKGIIEVMENSGSNVLNNLPIRNVRIKAVLDGLQPGIGWRKKPMFTYFATFDDFVWEDSPTYETWDTDYMNQEITRNVDEEQEQVDIEIKFIEKEKRILRTINKEIEKFNVIYDFRSGTWSGDDYFNDSDGYGHYNGSDFEMWFTLRQTDYDGDGIPWWVEVNVLDTDPRKDDSKLDPDVDGANTAWEWKWGYDPFVYDNHSILDPDNDGLQNTEECFMAKWLANPYYPDIYIETDYMEKAPFKPYEIKIEKGRILPIPRPRLVKTGLDGLEHVFWEESQQMLMEEFNKHGITVHIDDGIMGGGGELLPFENEPGAYHQDSGVVSEFYKNNFADERKGIFRYVFVAYGGGWCHPQDFMQRYDTICVPSNRRFFRNQMHFALTPRTMRIARAVQVMHELGHSCGLRHEEWKGVDNSTLVWKDYQSCMYYYYFGLRHFGYSDGSRGGEYDRNDWAALDISYFDETADDIEGIGSYY